MGWQKTWDELSGKSVQLAQCGCPSKRKWKEEVLRPHRWRRQSGTATTGCAEKSPSSLQPPGAARLVHFPGLHSALSVFLFRFLHSTSRYRFSAFPSAFLFCLFHFLRDAGNYRSPDFHYFLPTDGQRYVTNFLLLKTEAMLHSGFVPKIYSYDWFRQPEEIISLNSYLIRTSKNCLHFISPGFVIYHKIEPIVY